MNQLASELNRIVDSHSYELKPSTFYEELHRRFRKETLDNRFLLLLQLKGMEVHPKYPLSKLGTQSVIARTDKNKIVVNVWVSSHPSAGKHNANCYELELMMIRWGKTASCERQVSEWVEIGSKPPHLEFEFDPKTGTKHWLLCMLLRLGKNDKAIGMRATMGMQIVDAGSFVKKDLELLSAREKEKAMQRVEKRKPEVEEIKRVKAKG